MSWSRRDFLCTVPLAGGALVLVPSLVIRNAPVLSFHLDHPYMDNTGTADAYRPAAGLRSADAIAGMSDLELSRYYGFI